MNPAGSTFDQEGGVLIDSHADAAGGVRDGAEQAAITPALGEMLINDHTLISPRPGAIRTSPIR